MAALVLTMLVLGTLAAASLGPARHTALGLHRQVGWLLALLASIRLLTAWQVPPWPDHPDDKPHARAAARAVHRLLYVCLCGMPLIGVGMDQAAGIPLRIAGIVVPVTLFQPDAMVHATLRALHGLGALILAVSIGLHVLGAVHHRATQGARIWQRMW